jgi:hypothetical protein
MSCDVCAVGERHPQLIRIQFVNGRPFDSGRPRTGCSLQPLRRGDPESRCGRAVATNRLANTSLRPDLSRRRSTSSHRPEWSAKSILHPHAADSGCGAAPQPRSHAGGRPVCSRLAIITGTAVARGLDPPIRQARPPTHLVTPRERFARRRASSHTLRTACDTPRIPCAPSVRT